MPESRPQEPLMADGPLQGAPPPGRRSFWQAWLCERRWEHGGRAYERLGLRPVFGLISGAFGEALPPASSAAEPVDRAEAARVYWWSRYHEVVNALALALQAPLAPLGAAGGSPPLAAFGGALCAMHAACVALERYKRARGRAALEGWQGGEALAGARLAARYGPTPALLRGPAADAWFRPRRFEGEAFYRATGTWAFRRIVLRVYAVAFDGAPAARNGPAFLPGGPAGLADLEGQSRVAEVSHLCGMALHLPFLWLALSRGMPFGAAYVGFLLCLNLWCALIQRSHRARMARALGRRAARA